MKNLFEFYSDEGPERCGFILKDGEIVELENCNPDPMQGFEIDSQDILAYLPHLSGVWHTHPGSTSVLSGEDQGYMLIWPDLEHFVIGQDGVRKYVIKDMAIVDEDFLAR